MAARNVVAVDLGAESGRVVLGRFDGSRVALTELHRFPTPPRPSDGHLRWDLGDIWSQIQTGLAAAGAGAGTVDAVGVMPGGWTMGCSAATASSSATRSATATPAPPAWSPRPSAGSAGSGCMRPPASRSSRSTRSSS